MKKTEIILLGCGSSLGVPRIDGYWGKAKKQNKKNYRTRCSLFIKYGDINILIDTSPDIKNQLLNNKIRKIDFIVYSHDHADQTHGINELRPFFWINKKKIPIYADKKTSNYLLKSFKYLFVRKSKYYVPIFKMNIIKNFFALKKNNDTIKLETIKVKHGDIDSNGYLFNKIAYISDCSSISNECLKKLMNLKLLIIDCLKFKRHETHLNFKTCLSYIKILNPEKTILTNLHSDIDYSSFKKKLLKISKNIIPAYDGLRVSI
jgi:phosphoribosyl 1,2-cyclic phosphate phosphodiesterase